MQYLSAQFLTPSSYRGFGAARDSRSEVVEEKDGSMLLQMRHGSRIENPREYSADAVQELEDLLAEGSEVQQDPHRENFYQIENLNIAYYIHVSPVTGNVVLLAKWSRQPQMCYAGASSQSA
jgi:hypothetical protein